jgi:hypothetical protein
MKVLSMSLAGITDLCTRSCRQSHYLLEPLMVCLKEATEWSVQICTKSLIAAERCPQDAGRQIGKALDFEPKGIVCYDRHQQFAIEFNERNGFHHYRDVANMSKGGSNIQGFIVLSDEDGISIFDPLKLEISKAKTFPIITSLKVNNQVAMTHDGRSTGDEFSIKENVSVLDELILDYRHNNFSFEFSAMEMTSPEKNLYRHRLEGFDKDWIETDYKNRAATYTNLDAGTYTFKVKASNHHGIWSDQEKTLRC